MTEVVPQGLGAGSARAIAAAYLRPGLKETRRLLAELHLAGGRDPRLAELAPWTDALIACCRPTTPRPRRR